MMFVADEASIGVDFFGLFIYLLYLIVVSVQYVIKVSVL